MQHNMRIKNAPQVIPAVRFAIYQSLLFIQLRISA